MSILSPRYTSHMVAPRLKLRVVLIVMCGMLLFRVWYTEHFILTRVALEARLGQRMPASRVEEVIERRNKSMVWAYGLTPTILLTRIVFAAFLVQLFLAALGCELGLASCFRASAWAQASITLASLARLVPARASPPGGVGDFVHVPLSLADWLQPLVDVGPAAYALLDLVSPFELAWCAIAVWVLVRREFCPGRPAMIAVACAWFSMAFAEAGAIGLLTSLLV